MGISWILLIRAVSITMKFLALASSLLAAVSGQYLRYAGYPYAAHAIVGLKSAPCVNAANVPVPCAAGYYGKREAEADPQYLAYGAVLPYAVAAPHAVAATAYGGLVHSSLVGVCTNYLGAQVPC